MNDHSDARLEAMAETIVFAHEAADGATIGSPNRGDARLERAAVLASAALAMSYAIGDRKHPEFAPTKRLQERLAAAGHAYAAERRVAVPGRGPYTSAGATSTVAPTRRHSGRAFAHFFVGVAAGAALWFGLSGLQRAASVAEQRASLLADPTVVRVPWKPGPSPRSGAVVGEVLWSQDRQQGFLTFRGLPPCDDEHRFQLWIVDGNREGAPVDGGLFAVDRAGLETIVPVQAKLPIGKAAAFVVTLEGKSGVVVSKQEHVVAIAAP